jgi:hypothetical protein
VLHTLVTEARDGMTAAAVAVACQRDPDKPREIEEIEVALRVLLEDGLAEREGDPRPKTDPWPKLTRETEPVRAPDDIHEPRATSLVLYRPTRAAIRASELSF